MSVTYKSAPLNKTQQPLDSISVSALRYVARQPIFDTSNRIHGYELLYRSSMENYFPGTDSDTASRIMMDNTLLFGLTTLTENTRAFLNCTRSSLVDRVVTVLPPDRVVLEILENIVPDIEVLEACRALKQQGYLLALDDFTELHNTEEMLALADYIKVDWPTTPQEMRAKLRERIAGSNIRLLAEKVETPEEFALARKEGFHYFQGYYFCRPVMLSQTQVPQNQLNQLKLLRAIHQYPLNFEEILRLVQLDLSLSYRMLRLVNSANYAIRKEITTIKAALMVIGEQEFRKLASIAVAGVMSKGKSVELLVIALTRAAFCERLAEGCNLNPAEQYLIGLFSMLPAMLSVPMRNVTEMLPLSAEVRDALDGQPNRQRLLLSWIENHEKGIWLEDKPGMQLGMTESQIAETYAESVRWAEQSVRHCDS